MSVTIPSSFEVNCAPQRSLSFAIMDRSASSEEERASSNRLACQRCAESGNRCDMWVRE